MITNAETIREVVIIDKNLESIRKTDTSRHINAFESFFYVVNLALES